MKKRVECVKFDIKLITQCVRTRHVISSINSEGEYVQKIRGTREEDPLLKRANDQTMQII